MKRPKSKLLLLLALTGVALADQLVLRVVARDGRLLERRVAPFDPPLFTDGQRHAFEKLERFVLHGEPHPLLSIHDAELGWAPPPGGAVGEMHFDERGARLGAPLEPGAVTRHVVTLGCSFTLGDEVADEETWPRQLDALRADLRVTNLGMSGYGLDQALLRYRRDARGLGADEVWLGWLPPASLRTTTHFRPLVRHWTGPVLFKPRFVLQGEELHFVPNPGATLADTYRLLGDQRAFLAEVGATDSWVLRAPAAYAPLGSSWLHQSALARLWLTWREHGDRNSGPWLLDERSEVHRLVRALVLALRDDVERDGARFRLLVLPGREELEAAARGAAPYWRSVTKALEDEGVEVIDLREACLAAGMATSDAYWAGGGHYGSAGNLVVARALADR
ncbi:MAG: hypothetical protein H6828_06120 [Planctomycetes bacterium]|nr:hypothetical protein [Planctomycetota bacterium]